MFAPSGHTPKKLRPQLLVAIPLLLLGAIAAGCSSSSSDSSGLGGKGDNAAMNPPGGDYQVGASADGGDATARLELGNPLCHATTLTCDPDATGMRSCETTGSPFLSSPSDTTPAADGGTAGPTGACHVRDTGGTLGTTCTAAGPGRDEAACTKGTDCASGYECVGSPGKCRHYCCGGANACPLPIDFGDPKTFCDIQVTAEPSNLQVPVCMPTVECSLLKSDPRCKPSESCTIVDDNGVVSCVNTGQALVGDSCEITHCASDLACLGVSGSRKCYQLCRKSSSANVCAPDEKCKGAAPLFRDPDIGICSKV